MDVEERRGEERGTLEPWVLISGRQITYSHDSNMLWGLSSNNYPPNDIK